MYHNHNHLLLIVGVPIYKKSLKPKSMRNKRLSVTATQKMSSLSTVDELFNKHDLA